MYSDILIKNGTVFDGSGNPGFKSDVYISDGKIKSITNQKIGKADEIIDAKGLVVTPGFIDIHQHSDYTIFGVPNCDSYIHQGVTTITVGHCGLSLAPLKSDYMKDIIKFNEAFTLDFKVPYNWNSFGEYLDEVRKLKPGVNFWPQVGHSTLRASVMGYEARKATDREIEEMKNLLDLSIKEGARAMSIGSYAPAPFAETTELLELSKILAKYGTLLTVHLREKPYWIDEIFEIGKKVAIPFEIAHYDGTGIMEARSNGIDITYDAYPYRAGSSHLGEILPTNLYDGGVNSMLEKISDSNVRDRMKEIVKKRVANGYDWNSAVVAYLSNEKIKQYEGVSIGKIAKSENVDPVDLLCDILIEDKGKGMYVYRNSRKECYVFENLKNPNNFVMSDGWGIAPYEPIKRGVPHPRAYGSFPRVLGRYVRECNTISFQEAVRKMTFGPAQRLGIKDRGMLREELWADITILNPETIIDKATFDDPHQYPKGIEYVLVNGKIIIDKGKHTGTRSGMVL